MYSTLVLLVVIGLTQSAPQYTVLDDNGQQFSTSFQTPEGAIEQRRGVLVDNDLKDGHVLNQEGTLKYVSPEGRPVELSYYADKTGFHVFGPDLPQPPQPISPSFI